MYNPESIQNVINTASTHIAQNKNKIHEKLVLFISFRSKQKASVITL